MGSHSTDSKVFIRSMATRGFTGGLASALRGVLKLLDAYGKELLIVETAGAGQSEIDIMQVADIVVVVLTPESGDILQAMKAGMMEIGDIYVVNKADRPGAEQLAAAVKSVFSLQSGPRETPVVLTAEAANNQGIAELHGQIETARRMLNESGQLIIRRNLHRKHEFIATVEQNVVQQLSEFLQGNAAAARYLAEIENGVIDPQVAAHRFINGITLSHRPVSE
jgi:LAO/AO transport system kinase